MEKIVQRILKEENLTAIIPKQRKYGSYSGKVYLSAMIDCFDRMMVGWASGSHPNADLVNTMLDKVIAVLSKDCCPIIHSDRGCHFRWPEWIDRTNKVGFTHSMSRKGRFPDNAACEGFFG